MRVVPVVAVVGSTGKVGTAVSKELKRRGYDVRAIQGPRLAVSADRLAGLVRAQVRAPVPLAPRAHLAALQSLSARLAGCSAVVNCAGVATATARQSNEMLGANALLPFLIRSAQLSAGTARFIHVSSAAVQGRLPLSENLEWSPLTPYALSKYWGELCLLSTQKHEQGSLVIYRATSILSEDSMNDSWAARLLARAPLLPLAEPRASSTVCTSAQMAASVADLVEGDRRGIVLEKSYMSTEDYVKSVRQDVRILNYPRSAGEIIFALAFKCLHGARSRAWLRRVEVLAQGQDWRQS